MMIALKQVWMTKVPSKIKFFVWKVLLGRIPTREQLAKRGMIHNSHEKIYACCFKGNESLSHLFFGYRVSKKVWEEVFIWLDMEDVDFDEYIQNYFGFHVARRRKMKRSKTNLIWMAIVWSLWLMSNAIMFNYVITSIDDVISNLKYKTFVFVLVSFMVMFDYYDWCVST